MFLVFGLPLQMYRLRMWSISSFGLGTSSKGLEFISQGMVVEGPTVGSVLEGPAEVLTVPLLDLRGTKRDLRRRGSTMSWIAADNSASSQSSRSHRRRKELKSLGFRYRVSLRFFGLSSVILSWPFLQPA